MGPRRINEHEDGGSVDKSIHAHCISAPGTNPEVSE